MRSYSEDKVRERLTRRERKQDFERRMRRKRRSEDRSVFEEVFDKSTLMIIYSLLNRGLIEDIFGVVKSGKESRVYWGKGSEGIEIAIKIYLTTSAEFRRGMQKYIEGDPRFNDIDRTTKSLVYKWALKEYGNLKLARDAGVNVPRRVAIEKNVLLMEFIGSGGVPAPLLRESPLEEPFKTYLDIIDSVMKLYHKAQLVHGDLSEYNIMVWKGRPVVFDLSQAVKLDHNEAGTFLKRDLANISNYFARIGVDVPDLDELYRQVITNSAKQT